VSYFDLISEEVRRHSPSYGLTPYYLKEVLINDVPVRSGESQKALPIYIAIYLWEDYSGEDFMHHLKHSKEFLEIPDAFRTDFVRSQAERFKSGFEFQRWKSAQAAIATGIILGCCKKIGLPAVVVKEGSEPAGFVTGTNVFCLIKFSNEPPE
jgi:hypothetical protein